MSDSDESGVTYTEISSTFEELSDIGSPRVVPSLIYIPGPEEPQSPPPLDYVPESIYPEYMPQEDEAFPAKEQPLPTGASPTAQSPDYVPESDPEADPEEDDDEDPKEDPVDYPADGGDDGDDKEGSSEADDMDIEADDKEEEEEEHPAPADSVVVALPATDQALSAGGTRRSRLMSLLATPTITPAYRMTVGFLFQTPVPTPVWLMLEGGQTRLLLTTSEWLGIALSPRYEVGESSSAAARPDGGLRADYGFVATMDREIRRDPKRDVGYRQDTDEVYTRLDDEQSQRQLLAGRLNMLFRDRRAHAYTRHQMETEARLSREAWRRSMDASDLARAEVMSLRTTVLAQQSEIRELQSADRRRQTVISELLAADYRRQRQLTEALKLVKSLQTQMTELQRQQGPAKGPAQPELPEEAGSSS
ncbi:hypothetical protein Tco_0496157 [Tanacetum coccineum]